MTRISILRNIYQKSVDHATIIYVICVTCTDVNSAVTKTIATSLVPSKLDYCNSILYNIRNRELNKLQSVQNCLARVVTRSPQLCSVTPLLISLHWLPVQYRIKYKISTLTYKVIHKCQPVYLHNLLKPLNRTHIFCSSDDQLVVPRESSKLGERAFSVAAPQLWNCIPLEIKKSKSSKSFRKKLKTYISAKLFHPKSSVPGMLDQRIGTTNGQ